MNRRKILLVDNTEIMLRLEKTFLTRSTFEIIIARTGAEGLSKARECRPHLMVVDLDLPDLDGDALCRQLKGDAETKGIAIVIVATSRDRSNRERSLLAGCDGFMTKPLQRESFCRLAESLLGVAIRAHRRVPSSLDCEVRAIGLRIPSTLLDLSEGGAFVSPASMLPDVQEFELRFCLPGNTGVLTVASRVCWSDREGTSGRRGVGVQFLDLDSEDAVRLKTFIAVRTREADDAGNRTGLMRSGMDFGEGGRVG